MRFDILLANLMCEAKLFSIKSRRQKINKRKWTTDIASTPDDRKTYSQVTYNTLTVFAINKVTIVIFFYSPSHLMFG